MANVVSVNISERKGEQKHPVPEIQLKFRHGIVGDAHAGDWHRQISLLAEESVDTMRASCPIPLDPGVFAENINTEGIDLKHLPVGTHLRIGETEVEVTQIGKECHSDCAIKLGMGKEHLYVWEMTPGMLHEDEGAERLLALCANENMERSGVKEGKIELKASCDGLFLLRSESLRAVNAIDELMIATRKGGTAVKKGDKLAGMRVIPLIIAEEKLTAAKAAAGDTPLLELRPWVRKTAAIVATGSEVKKGLIQDTFTPVVKDKLSAYGIETISVSYSGDGVENVAGAISQARQTGAEVILCTGGMSVDPDDNTPGGIRQSGAKIVTYGAPVLPGAMFLLGYYDDGTPVMGLPGCVMYAGATIFDLVLPWVAADVSVTKEWIVSLGEGGLCLGCQPCRWPICPFGK